MGRALWMFAGGAALGWVAMEVGLGPAYALAPIFVIFVVMVVRDVRRGRRKPAPPKAGISQKSGWFAVRLTPSFADHLERCKKAGMTDEQAIRAWKRVER